MREFDFFCIGLSFGNEGSLSGAVEKEYRCEFFEGSLLSGGNRFHNKFDGKSRCA